MATNTDGRASQAGDITRLERELAYFRREAAELGARLIRTQEELHRNASETQRNAQIVRVIREIHRIASSGETPQAFPQQALQAIAETARCPHAVLLRKHDMGTYAFRVVAAAGVSERSDNPKRIEKLMTFGPQRPSSGVPAFLIGSADDANTLVTVVQRLVAAPQVLWIYDAVSKYALALGRLSEGPRFHADDLGLAEIALDQMHAGIERILGRWAATAESQPTARLTSPLPRSTEIADLERGIPGGIGLTDRSQRGKRILDVAVVARPFKPPQRGCFVTYLRVDWEQEWRVMLKIRGGPERQYSELHKLERHLRQAIGYAGPITLWQYDDQRLPVAIALRERRAAAGPSNSDLLDGPVDQDGEHGEQKGGGNRSKPPLVEAGFTTTAKSRAIVKNRR